MPVPRTVLVVEDDAAIRRGLVDALEFAGFRAAATASAQEGQRLALELALDLAILDVVLPDGCGFEMLTRIRRCRPQLPVIMVTARGAEPDRIAGLRGGADDYVVKPFSAGELLARVEAVLRRSAERPLDLERAIVAGRVVDFPRREARLPDGSVRALSEREAAILRYLVTNPGRAVPRDELLQHVWGLNPQGVHTRTIDMHVARLRDKLGDPSQAPEIIVTVRGVGYMLRTEPEVQPRP